MGIENIQHERGARRGTADTHRDAATTMHKDDQADDEQAQDVDALGNVRINGFADRPEKPGRFGGSIQGQASWD